MDSKISYCFLLNSIILFSKVSHFNCQCVTKIFFQGKIFSKYDCKVKIVSTLLCIKNTCHHLSNSLLQASKINQSLKSEIIV